MLGRMTTEIPLRTGHLRVSDGNDLYYEAAGDPQGSAVLWLHGGPGSGAGAGHRRRIDPTRQQAITFDQRGCGRSRPLVTERLDLLDTNTTPAMIEDIEALRRHLGIERWMVTGASWGTTLALAYAQAHRGRAAAAWGRWEDTHVSLGPGWEPDPRWHTSPDRDVLATLVTHYWSSTCFGGDDILGRMERLAGIPGTLIHGRRDVSGPAVTAWELHKAWPGSELILLDEGHGGPESVAALRRAIAADLEP